MMIENNNSQRLNVITVLGTTIMSSESRVQIPYGTIGCREGPGFYWGLGKRVCAPTRIAKSLTAGGGPGPA